MSNILTPGKPNGAGSRIVDPFAPLPSYQPPEILELARCYNRRGTQHVVIERLIATIDQLAMGIHQRDLQLRHVAQIVDAEARKICAYLRGWMWLAEISKESAHGNTGP